MAIVLLLVGMAVVGVVLVGAAVVITRSTESYLVERVDAQLAAAQPSVEGGGFEQHGGPPDGGGGLRPGGNLNTLYIGIVEGDTVRTVATPAFADSGAPVPAIDVSRAFDSNGRPAKEPFTVGTDPPSDTRYRVVAFQGDHGGATFVAALSLADVDASALYTLRRIDVARGDDVQVGALLATFSTTADESPEGDPARPVRVTIAGILAQPDMWREEPR